MNSATRVYASTFGAIMALAGIEHGIGEVLQGSIAPGSVMIKSWPDSAFFSSLSGEPAMTVVPNLLFTGILAVLVSLALLVWSVLFVAKKNGGWVMIFLSIAMLLVGGGIFPPVFGILIGVVATRINVPVSPSKDHRSEGFQLFLASLWPWTYSACIIAWLSVFPAGYLFGASYLLVILVVLFSALGTLVLTVFSGFARDALRQAGKPSSTRLTGNTKISTV